MPRRPRGSRGATAEAPVPGGPAGHTLRCGTPCTKPTRPLSPGAARAGCALGPWCWPPASSSSASSSVRGPSPRTAPSLPGCSPVRGAPGPAAAWVQLLVSGSPGGWGAVIGLGERGDELPRVRWELLGAVHSWVLDGLL